MRISDLALRIADNGAGAWDVHFRACEKANAGEDVIFLSIGDHDFHTPEPVVEVAVDALRKGRHHYTPAAGEDHYRASIARRHSRETGHAVTADNVIVLPGAQCGLYAAAMCVAGPGDEVIVPEPMYASYAKTILSSGASVVFVPLRPENGFHLDPADVAAAVTTRTRAILFNSPHNPTGAVMGKADLEALAGICIDNDLWLLSDEVYATLTYDVPHISPCSLDGMGGRTVTINSMSKSHAMTGWRMGWVVVPDSLAGPMIDLAGCMLFGSQPFIQDAAAFALDRENGDVEAMRQLYRRRRDLICDRLDAMNSIAVHRPEGAIFVMVDIRSSGLTAQEFANRFLDEENVAMLPGDGFGPSGAGHLRLSLAADDARLAQACDRLERFLGRL